MQKINLFPTHCNNCGWDVIYTSNATVYNGRKYGSGYCYLCTNDDCDSYVGTHINKPKEAFGILADKNMRKGKMMCHEIFDSKWKSFNNSKRRKKVRSQMYSWLARQLEIKTEDCHFGYFDIDTLRIAYRILLQIKDAPLQFGKKGKKIINQVNRPWLDDRRKTCKTHN